MLPPLPKARSGGRWRCLGQGRLDAAHSDGHDLIPLQSGSVRPPFSGGRAQAIGVASLTNSNRTGAAPGSATSANPPAYIARTARCNSAGTASAASTSNRHSWANEGKAVRT